MYEREREKVLNSIHCGIHRNDASPMQKMRFGSALESHRITLSIYVVFDNNNSNSDKRSCKAEAKKRLGQSWKTSISFSLWEFSVIKNTGQKTFSHSFPCDIMHSKSFGEGKKTFHSDTRKHSSSSTSTSSVHTKKGKRKHVDGNAFFINSFVYILKQISIRFLTMHL